MNHDTADRNFGIDPSSQSKRVRPSVDASTMLNSAGWADCSARLSRVRRSAAARSRVGVTTGNGKSSVAIRKAHCLNNQTFITDASRWTAFCPALVNLHENVVE